MVLARSKAGQMVKDPAVASVNTTREEHEAEKEDEGDGPYYDAAIEAVAEQSADGKSRRGLHWKRQHIVMLSRDWR